MFAFVITWEVTSRRLLLLVPSSLQLYRDAAIAEHEASLLPQKQLEKQQGVSGFYNSRADEAYLLQRLDKGIPSDHVLYAAAHKYLRASFANKTWSFTQRKRMVDRWVGRGGDGEEWSAL